MGVKCYGVCHLALLALWQVLLGLMMLLTGKASLTMLRIIWYL